jgi:dTDP-4-amino-4,6-dideoxygalactose transaminase
MFGNYIALDELYSFCQKQGIQVLEDRALSFPDHSSSALSDNVDGVIYSFGRGKPLSLGYGGLLLSKNACPSSTDMARIRNNIAGLSKLFFTACFHIRWLNRSAEYLINRLRVVLFTGIDVVNRDNGYRDSVSAGCSVYLQSVISGLIKDIWNTRLTDHMKIFNTYYAGINDNSQVVRLSGTSECVAASSFFAIKVPRRNALIKVLLQKGINLSWFYSYSIGDLLGERAFPNAGELARQIVLLPIHRDITLDQVKYICSVINKWSEE